MSPHDRAAVSSESSPAGRRVLVAVVTGELGERIQAWRQRYDPEQARRLPPHATLCYWAPTVEPDLLERQVRHAFDRPISVRLGGVHEFGNQDHTFYVSVEETAALDAARLRLYDGTHLELPGRDARKHALFFEDPLCPTCKSLHERLRTAGVLDRLDIELSLFPLDRKGRSSLQATLTAPSAIRFQRSGSANKE